MKFQQNCCKKNDIEDEGPWKAFDFILALFSVRTIQGFSIIIIITVGYKENYLKLIINKWKMCDKTFTIKTCFVKSLSLKE